MKGAPRCVLCVSPISDPLVKISSKIIASVIMERLGDYFLKVCSDEQSAEKGCGSINVNFSVKQAVQLLREH